MSTPLTLPSSGAISLSEIHIVAGGDTAASSSDDQITPSLQTLNNNNANTTPDGGQVQYASISDGWRTASTQAPSTWTSMTESTAPTTNYSGTNLGITQVCRGGDVKFTPDPDILEYNVVANIIPGWGTNSYTYSPEFRWVQQDASGTLQAVSGVMTVNAYRNATGGWATSGKVPTSEGTTARSYMNWTSGSLNQNATAPSAASRIKLVHHSNDVIMQMRFGRGNSRPRGYAIGNMVITAAKKYANTSTTALVNINDSDVRDLINKASAAQMSFSEFYGVKYGGLSTTMTIGSYDQTANYGGLNYGYNDHTINGLFATSWGSLADNSVSGIQSGAVISQINHGSLTSSIQLSISDNAAIANSGWTTLTIGSTTLSRTSATFSQATTSISGYEHRSSWTFSSQGSTPPFGTSGTVSVTIG